LALVIGCGGSGGGSIASGTTGLTSTTTSTSTSTTTTTSGGTGTIPTGTLPSNVIFYIDGGAANVIGNSFENYDVYYVSPNGTGQALYVTVPSNVSAAAANPSVQGQFVFAADTDGSGTNYQIYSNTTLSTTGAKTIVGTNLIGVDAIAVSPDGNSVIYSTIDINDNPSIYKVAITGGTPTLLYQGDDPEVDPTNTYIVFDQIDQTNLSNEYIFTSKLDGTGVTQLTSGATAFDSLPQWDKPTSATPTPGLTSFNRMDGTNSSIQDIFTYNVSTKALTQITTSPDNTNTGLIISGPSFSPDDSTLSFYAQPINSGVNNLPSGVYTASSTPTSPVTPAVVAGSATIQQEPVVNVAAVLGETQTYWTGNAGRSASAMRFFQFRRHHAKKGRAATKK
jgi:hypothetical protein